MNKTPSYPPVRGRLYRDCSLELFPSVMFIEKNISELLLTSLPHYMGIRGGLQANN